MTHQYQPPDEYIRWEKEQREMAQWMSDHEPNPDPILFKLTFGQNLTEYRIRILTKFRQDIRERELLSGSTDYCITPYHGESLIKKLISGSKE